MPTYEYKFKHCGLRFERRQKISDKPVPTCPQCGCSLQRPISDGSGIIFK